MARYNPIEVESKWQKIWEENEAFKAEDYSDRKKLYAAEMFPYPSGAGLHTGHVRNFTIVDVIARFYKQLGYNVMRPFGYDTFGLPAENYAIKTGISPQVATAENIKNFKYQAQRIGFAIDWSREINSSDPKYYRWTQWVFTKLFSHYYSVDEGKALPISKLEKIFAEQGNVGLSLAQTKEINFTAEEWNKMTATEKSKILDNYRLAYRHESAQWWCSVDKTVLANEQVENGKCWRCGNEVEKKQMKQWFFRITAYADELLSELDNLDWPTKIKTMQRNWIGRSEGAEIDFVVQNNKRISDKYASFIMGAGNISSDLKKIGIEIIKEDADENYYSVYIPKEKINAYERLISDRLEPGFWNEYIGSEVVFIFKDKQGEIYQLVWGQDNDLDILDLCELYANTEFDSVEEMLNGNTFYRDSGLLKFRDESIKVFTTRPDTIFGATFMVLAPEHPIVEKITTDEHRQKVNQYIEQSQKKSDIERQENKEKTGVFTGSYAINPATDEKIPIWIADYVLTGYGTGAIMAVPAHDERDNAFAKKFDLPIVPVIAPDFGEPHENEQEVTGTVIIGYNPNLNKYLAISTKTGNLKYRLPSGGINDGETSVDCAKRELREETGFMANEIMSLGGPIAAHYYNSTKDSYRRAKTNAFLTIIKDEKPTHDAARESHESDFENVWLDFDELYGSMIHDKPHADHWLHVLDMAKRRVENDLNPVLLDEVWTGEGVMVNSGQFDGQNSSEAADKVINWLEQKGAAKPKTQYKMRDWLISRQRYWGCPIPIVYDAENTPHVIDEQNLPVLLPEIDDYKPDDSGRSALAKDKDWLNATINNQLMTRETDTMDGYACSSWYLLRYADPHNNKNAWDSEKTNYWNPVDFYVGGDHAVAHLLYVRFWTKFFNDLGLVDFREPVKTLLYNGYVNAPDGRKMSKSLGNVIDPLDIIDNGYGADTLRTYEMFMGPYEQDVAWDITSVGGVFRFLNRVWNLVQDNELSDKNDSTLLRAQHKTIKKVTEDLYRHSFNTVVAALMEYLNTLTANVDKVSRENVEVLLQLMVPFAPHIAAELFEQIGNTKSIENAGWPKFDEKFIETDEMTIAVQVNGKLRGEVTLDKNVTKQEIENAALELENVQNFVANKKPARIIYVPGKIINIVI